MSLLADDDVVVHGDAERAGDLDDRLRHLDIGARRRRVARWMVVHEDDGGGRELERALDHLARVHRRVIDGSDLLGFVGDQLVALVEEQDAELLLLGEGHRAAACTILSSAIAASPSPEISASRAGGAAITSPNEPNVSRSFFASGFTSRWGMARNSTSSSNS